MSRQEIIYGPVNNTYGYKNVRWVENASCGLRLVGFADKIAPIDHQGWYTRDDDCDSDTYRGVVYQLPARNGLAMYVYGYADPNDDDCALLCFDDPKTEMSEAARAADRLAEIWAEHERDYHRAWDAGRCFAELGDQIADMRMQALQLAWELKEMRRRGVAYKATNETLREKIKTLYRSIQRARKKRKQLVDDYGREDAFKETAGEA